MKFLESGCLPCAFFFFPLMASEEYYARRLICKVVWLLLEMGGHNN